MYEREDSNDSPNQTNMGTLSPDRFPQLKPWNCGYDCGLGCEKEKDKGGGAERECEDSFSSSSTVVSSSEAQDEEGRASEDFSGSQASMANSSTAASDGTGLALSSPQEFDSMEVSMVVQPNSPGDHSPMTPTSRSVSPWPNVYWPSNRRVASPLPIRYYFLQSPLRLSPQFEHCRGDPESHLVLPDRARLVYMMEQLAREYAPAYRNVSPPSFGAC